MYTIYITSNETGRIVAEYTGSSNDECEKWAADNYGSNDYSWSYSK